MKPFKLFCLFIISVSYSFAQLKPNVIVVLADDIGVGDISYYRKLNSDSIIVKTPTIDRLAKAGILFTNAHAPAALCAPSRYAIMTGNHSYRSYAPRGVWGSYQKSPIENNQLTLGRLMQQAGYNTAFFGKWGFGMDFARKNNPNKIYRGLRNKPELEVDITKIINHGPQQNGFNYSYMYPAGIQAAPYAVYENGIMMPLHKNSKIIKITQKKMDKIGFKLDKMEGLGDSYWNPYNAGELLINKAVSYIEKSSEATAPFFMYYCTQAVHKPHTPSTRLNNTDIAGTTPSKHLDMVKELDVQMELMVKALKAKGILNNTIFIFTSDNGGLLIPETIKSGHTSNAHYRGGKNQAYEGGHRVPFIVHWPQKIKPNLISESPILGLDILATLARVTHQVINKNQALDSSNILPILLNEKDIEPHQFLINQSGTGKEVIIIEYGWKLIVKIENEETFMVNQKLIALFNLNENPSELEEKNHINNPKYKNKRDFLLSNYNTIRSNKLPTGIK